LSLEATDLKASEQRVGQLLPVLVNKKGVIIDGRHRVRANKNWKRVEWDLDELRTHVARLTINTQRRVADSADYDELADYLVRTENLKPGQIAERISELTGIGYATVTQYLDGKFLQAHKSSLTKDLVRNHLVKVPEVVAEPLRKAIDELQEIVNAHPDKQDEIVRKFSDGLGFAATLSRPRGKSTLPPEREANSHDFFKRIGAWANAASVLDKVPVAMAVQVVRGMPPEQRDGFLRLARLALGYAEKLRKILAEIGDH
jgi:DNA-binding ferritin-like protein